MSAGIGMYFMALYSAVLSLCLSIEQVFCEPLPTLNFLYGVSMLWTITFICIGVGLVIDGASREENNKGGAKCKQ